MRHYRKLSSGLGLLVVEVILAEKIPVVGDRFQVSLVPMLEQRIAKHTLNSVLKIANTGTLFTVPHKKYPFSLCSHK